VGHWKGWVESESLFWALKLHERQQVRFGPKSGETFNPTRPMAKIMYFLCIKIITAKLHIKNRFIGVFMQTSFACCQIFYISVAICQIFFTSVDNCMPDLQYTSFSGCKIFYTYISCQLPAARSSTHQLLAARYSIHQWPAVRSSIHELPATRSSIHQLPADRSSIHELPAARSSIHQLPATRSSIHQLLAGRCAINQLPPTRYKLQSNLSLLSNPATILNL